MTVASDSAIGPLAMAFDGVVPCLRIYTPAELKAMAVDASGDAFEWEAGYDTRLAR